MENWLKGLLGTSTALIIIGIVIATGYYISVAGAAAAFICSALVCSAFLSLIYAVENNEFASGALVPILIVVAVLIGIFAQPPALPTFGLCIFTSIFGVIMIQRGE
jgi:hypothetical protein